MATAIQALCCCICLVSEYLCFSTCIFHLNFFVFFVFSFGFHLMCYVSPGPLHLFARSAVLLLLLLLLLVSCHNCNTLVLVSFFVTTIYFVVVAQNFLFFRCFFYISTSSGRPSRLRSVAFGRSVTNAFTKNHCRHCFCCCCCTHCCYCCNISGFNVNLIHSKHTPISKFCFCFCQAFIVFVISHVCFQCY